MRVLNPVGVSKFAQAKDEVSTRIGQFDDKTIGVIDDGAGKVYFDRIQQLFSESFKGVRVVHRVKPMLSAPAPLEIIDEIASISDAAIVGTGV